MSSRSKGAPASGPEDAPESAQTPAAPAAQPEGTGQLPAPEPAPAAGPPVQYTTYYTQRFQGEDGNRVLYFLQDDSKAKSTLAAAGHDPRGTGHFTYLSTPEMQDAAPPLKCTNRAGVLAWLEALGVVPGAPADGAKVPNVVVSKLPSASHGGPRKPGKRRAADGGAEGPAKRRAKGGHDEGGVSYEVSEAFKQYPELFSWITAQPDEALVKAFIKYREDLQSPVCDEAPESLGVKEDGTPTGWLTTATAVRILDDISQCAEVSLRLLQVTELGGAVARLRTHVSPEVSGRAEKITARWRAAADATMQRAKEYMQNNNIRMHIKQVIIEGFKSYKDQTISEPFSPRINIVVGANGSGKSNFFDAIRFVLNDTTTSMRAEDRQKLLHEGAGHAVMSAYVEIVFDNSDNRLPVDRDEVRLRRTIGLKKDEFTLDRKHITKTEVMNLLESAGFSRANPYYIVQQGKIAALSTMKDSQRLALLKEVGGTKIYEERRHDSLKLMAESEGRSQRIQEVVDQLNEKLAELEEEREELAEYQRLDKQRRAMEFAIYDRDLSGTKAALQEVERERQAEGAKAGGLHQAKRDAHAQLKRLTKDLQALQQQQPSREAALKEAAEEKAVAVQRRAQAELDIKELRERLRTDSTARTSGQQEMDLLTSQIAEKEAEAQNLQAELQRHRSQEEACSTTAAEANSKLQALYQKQGRSAQFASVAERDKWLREEIRKLQEAQGKTGSTRRAVQDAATSLNSELMELSQSLGDAEAGIRRQEEGLAAVETEQAALLKRRDAMQNDRRDLWRDESSIKEKQKQLQEEMRKRETQMQKAVSRDVQRGLDSVRRIVKEHNIQGVFGPLVELFSCMEQMNAAVEVTAGNQLFNVVVDNDATSTTIIKYLNSCKGGRVTFVPLNRIQPPEVRYPKEQGHDAVPMIKHLKYKDQFRPVMQQVFGKTMVCKDLEVATEVSRSSDLNCVTMDGDQRDKKGTLTGGFIDSSRSRLAAMRAIKDAAKQLNAAKAELEKHSERLAQAEQGITQIMGELERLNAKRTHLRDGLNTMRAERKTTQVREERLREQLDAKEKQLADMEGTAESLEAQIRDLQAELGTDLTAQLSAAEKTELKRLVPRLEKLKEEAAEARAARMEVETALQALQELLDSDLRRRRRELQESLTVLEVETDESTISTKQAEAEAAGAAVSEATSREQSAAKAVEDASRRMAELQAELEQLKQDERREQLRIQEEAGKMEHLMAQRAALQVKKADFERRIKDLGSLPGDAFDKYRDAQPAELHKQLTRCNSQLKKYSSVNKKALDQYVNFTEQREELVARHEENRKGEGKIRDLIQTLDLRKDEAVERTFKGVAKSFREIFRDLAPGGHGELVMQKRVRRADAAGPDGDELGDGSGGEERDGDAGGSGISEKYAGVKVKVSFGAGEVMTMKQLSGGQKTLVALALILAIQRCDPAAFYLFDEIDAALDPQYRTTVARMLAQQAADERNPSQFIVTTFHPQIIQQADKIYGVSHSHRISRINVVTKEDALEFIQTAEQRHHDEEEQQQHV